MLGFDLRISGVEGDRFANFLPAVLFTHTGYIFQEILFGSLSGHIFIRANSPSDIMPSFCSCPHVMTSHLKVELVTLDLTGPWLICVLLDGNLTRPFFAALLSPVLDGFE